LGSLRGIGHVLAGKSESGRLPRKCVRHRGLNWVFDTFAFPGQGLHNIVPQRHDQDQQNVFAVGMSEAIDLGKPQPDPSLGGEAQAGLSGEGAPYTIYFFYLYFCIFFI
jgi:hypothetical protein